MPSSVCKGAFRSPVALLTRVFILLALQGKWEPRQLVLVDNLLVYYGGNQVKGLPKGIPPYMDR